METFFGFDLVALLGFAGLIGVALYIGAYGGLQLGFLKGTGYAYTLLNMAGASLVLMSLATNFNLSSAIIQITWIGISVVGLARVAYLNTVTRLNKEETSLIDTKLPGMSKPTARKFLNAGLWVDAEAGNVIATENQSIGALYFLSRGEVDVTINGALVGTSKPATFIGEMTCFDAGPATATVTVSHTARFFRITTEALNALCRRDSDLKQMLENALGADTRMKLVAANTKLTESPSVQ